MPVIYRTARAQDLQRGGELVTTSINALCERHGFGPIAVVRPPAFSMFSLKDDPQGLWVAEDAGELVGFAFSWACGDVWFLAQLFVSPDRQGCGIGPALLERTFEHAQTSKARIKALITFAFNTVSQGLYMRHGLFPRCPIYNLQVTREALAHGLHGARLPFVPIENTAPHLRALSAIDVATVGSSRAKHHRFLVTDGATRGFLLRAGDEFIGYVYVSDGHVGPLAVTQRTAVAAAFRTALDLAATNCGAPCVSAFVPGPCDAALTTALATGMRITSPMVLMATGDFGNWAQYLPRNPGFM